MILSSRRPLRFIDRILRRRNEVSLSAIWWRYFSALMLMNGALSSIPLLLCAIALKDVGSAGALFAAILLALVGMGYHLLYLSRNQFLLSRRPGLMLFSLSALLFFMGAAVIWKWIGGLGGLSGGSLKMVKLDSLAVFGLGGLFYVIRLWEVRHYPRHLFLGGSHSAARR